MSDSENGDQCQGQVDIKTKMDSYKQLHSLCSLQLLLLICLCGQSDAGCQQPAALCGRSDEKLTQVWSMCQNNHAARQRILGSSSSIELPQPTSTDDCSHFANHLSPQVSLHRHPSMPGKLVFLPVATCGPVACTFSSTLPVACKLLNLETSQCLTQGQTTSTDFPLHTMHMPHTPTHIHTGYTGPSPRGRNDSTVCSGNGAAQGSTCPVCCVPFRILHPLRHCPAHPAHRPTIPLQDVLLKPGSQGLM